MTSQVPNNLFSQIAGATIVLDLLFLSSIAFVLRYRHHVPARCRKILLVNGLFGLVLDVLVTTGPVMTLHALHVNMGLEDTVQGNGWIDPSVYFAMVTPLVMLVIALVSIARRAYARRRYESSRQVGQALYIAR